MMADVSSEMENCPYCGRAFKRLKSHLPHCKMAGAVKTSSVSKVQTSALTDTSKTGAGLSTAKQKKQNKDLTQITKKMSQGENKRRKSDSPDAVTERIRIVHTAKSGTVESKGKPKRQTTETMQGMTQKQPKSLTESTKGIVLEVKHLKDTAKLQKSKGQAIFSQANGLPNSTLTVNEGKSAIKDLLVQDSTQYTVKSREVRLKFPSQENRAEPFDVSTGISQNISWNQNHNDTMIGGQQRDIAPTSMDECIEMEYGSYCKPKGSSVDSWVDDTHKNLPGQTKQWEDCEKGNKTERSCRDTVHKSNGREKKEGAKVLVALEEDKRLPSQPNCITLMREPHPGFTAAQPSLRTSEREEREDFNTTPVEVMQSLSNEQDSSGSVLKNLEGRPVNQYSGLTLNDKQSCASLPPGCDLIRSGSLGLQYFPELYDSYLRLNMSCERPLCWNAVSSRRWQAPFSEVSLLERRVTAAKLRKFLSWPAARGSSAKQFPAAVYRAWARHGNKFMNMKVGVGGLTVLVAGCCAWQYELIKLDCWRKDP